MHVCDVIAKDIVVSVTVRTTTTRVAVQTRGMVVHRFVSCSVCHCVNLSGLPILMASPADGPHEGGMRRREGARARRERRQRAEARFTAQVGTGRCNFCGSSWWASL